MKRLFWYTLLVFAELLILVFAVSAQTVSPIIAEGHGARARGEFTVRNDGLKPLDVRVEAFSFDVDKDGNPKFRPLDVTTIHLKMDSFSARVGIRQSHTFFYEVTCFQRPCWLSIYSVMTVGQTAQGMNVALRLPHTIYLCEKEKKCREHVRRDVWGLK